MSGAELLQKVRELSDAERRNMPYDEFVWIMKQLSRDERVILSKIFGYPVFTRKCMGDLNHDFVLLQDGAAAIIVNDQEQILLQSRADNDRWGLPGGCQELEETFEDTIIREIKEETNLDVTYDNLQLLAVVSGPSRRNSYPNGDSVVNNTVLYCVRNYSGELKWDSESKKMQFFDLDNLPANQNDPDLINIYKRSLERGRRM